MEIAAVRDRTHHSTPLRESESGSSFTKQAAVRAIRLLEFLSGCQKVPRELAARAARSSSASIKSAGSAKS
jgi:hypothetical protein